MNIPDRVFIPIGNDCSVAYNLSQLGKRQFALPFDWIRLNNIAQFIEILEDDFNNFLDLDYLKVKRKTFGFPLLEDDWIDTESIGPVDGPSKESEGVEIVNTKYNISFLHDFSSENFTDELPSVTEKYSRRIKRLREILVDQEITKVFVRLTLKKKIVREKELLIVCLEKLNIQNFKLQFIEVEGLKCCSEDISIKDRWKRGPPEQWLPYL